MSGPIVRSAPSKKFTANWDAVFGTKAGAKEKSPAKTAARTAVKKKKKS